MLQAVASFDSCYRLLTAFRASFAIESYLYETDFTTGPSQNYQYYVLLQLVQILTRILKTH